MDKMRLVSYKIILLSILVLSSSIVFSQNALAGEITKSVSNGSTEAFRDINNLDETPDATVSLDKEFYSPGETATITLNDTNADLDIGAIDFESATVSGSSVTLTESGANTGIFSGTFTTGDDDITVDYTQDPKQSARAEIDFPLSSGGSAIISDMEFTETEITNLGIKPVIGGLNVTLTDGAAFSSVPTVTLSFANANLTGGIDVRDLEMWHKAPGQNWEKITDSCNTRNALLLPCDFFDNSAKTITSDPVGAGFSGTDGQGGYVLAIDTGVPGGGGGGLVRPGLVVNALAGISALGGGGSSSTSSPSVSIGELVARSAIDVPPDVEQMVLTHDSTEPIHPMPLDTYSDYEDFDFPLIINDVGFITGGFANTIDTQTFTTNSPVTITFTVFEAEKIQHFSLYTNLRDDKTKIHQSDTQLLYNDGKDLKIVDPNGFFSDANLTIQEEEDSPKKQVTVELVFAKPMDTSDIAIRSWDPNLFSKDMFLLDAIKVESDEPEFDPVPDSPEPELEPLKTQSIPIWVKNNAAWWSDNMIDDEDFVAGIQYLINNDIIILQEKETTDTVTEIPDWVKNNAEWWSDGMINDDDFTKSMEWLIEKGVITLE